MTNELYRNILILVLQLQENIFPSDRNLFFAHMENVLISIVFDNKRNIRELSLRGILKPRHSVQNGKGIRNLIGMCLN